MVSFMNCSHLQFIVGFLWVGVPLSFDIFDYTEVCCHFILVFVSWVFHYVSRVASCSEISPTDSICWLIRPNLLQMPLQIWIPKFKKTRGRQEIFTEFIFSLQSSKNGAKTPYQIKKETRVRAEFFSRSGLARLEVPSSWLDAAPWSILESQLFLGSSRSGLARLTNYSDTRFRSPLQWQFFQMPWNVLFQIKGRDDFGGKW